MRSVLLRHGGWSLIDQAFSSATNLGLTVVAGRQLGPAGLGSVALGFAVYLVALGVQRALLTEPLLAKPVEEEALDRGVTRGALLSISFGIAIALVCWLIPGLVGGEGLDFLRAFAPWILPALLQDYWRMQLFRAGRARLAAVNDGVWAVAMAVALALAPDISSPSGAVSIWGVGAAAAALLGFAQCSIRLAPLASAWSWWRAELWPLGRWLAVESLIYNAGNYGVFFVVLPLIGRDGIGALRGVQSVFAPLSLVIPALSVVGLPALARVAIVSRTRALRMAGNLGAVAFGLSGVYLFLVGVGGTRLLELVFGPAFGRFDELIAPTGLGQVVTAAAVGFPILLKAQQRGRAVAGVRLTGACASFVLIVGFAAWGGVVGAAWGLSAGALISAITAWILVRSHAEVASSPAPEEVHLARD